MSVTKDLQKTLELLVEHAYVGEYGRNLNEAVVEWCLDYNCEHLCESCNCLQKEKDAFFDKIPIPLEEIKEINISEEGHREDHEQWLHLEYKGKNYRVDVCYYEDEGVSSVGRVRECKVTKTTVDVWEDI